MMLVDQSGTGLPGSLQKAESPPKEPVRLRLDLYSDDQDRQVSRLVGLGATRVEHWLYPGDADFVTRHRVSEGVGALRMTRPRLLAVPAA